MSLNLVYWGFGMEPFGQVLTQWPFSTLNWILEMNSAYIFLTDFFCTSLQGQWVSQSGGLHFASTIQNISYKIFSGCSHVGFTVFTLLFQTIWEKTCSCCSLSCAGLLPLWSKFSLCSISPLVSWCLSSIGLWPAVSWELLESTVPIQRSFWPLC